MSTGGTRTIPGIVSQRDIAEVLHFTTNFGLTGIGAKGAVLCRDLLDVDEYLEHIYKPVWTSRWKDSNWTGYVNMSISRVSRRMLGVSQRNHDDPDLWWPVLSFGPTILNDPSVTFTTTNNSYEETVERAEGPDGLDAMFAAQVPWGYYGSVHRRWVDQPDSWTTDPQAEVLYPGQVPLTHLQAIYVADEDRIDDANSLSQLWPATANVPVIHRPEVFQ